MTKKITRSKGGQGWNWGVALLLFGLLFLLRPFLGWTFGALLWPLFVLFPGILLFYLVKVLGKRAAILTVPASMITMTGLLLLYQNIFHHWASWAYAWTLIVPTAFGLGLAFFGDLSRRPKVAQVGEGTAKVGVGLFLAGALFFEVILNISGLLGSIVATLFLPVALIAAGLYLVRRRKRSRRSRLAVPSRERKVLSPGRTDDDLFNWDLDRELEKVKR